MGHTSVLLLVVLLVLGAWSCQPPDCDHPDCGSCSNACCLLEFEFASNADDVFKMIVENLKKGGDDMRYTFVNSTDYRKDMIPVKYQLQAIHTTKVNKYNDTLNFLISSNESMKTLVKGFSISRIEGAYCDAGQNYKNLVGFIKGLDQSFAQRYVYGCKGF